VQNPREFLSPDQPRTEDNPFWIYHLNVVEIKEETSIFSQISPGKRLAAHFMNAKFIANVIDPRLYRFCKFDKRRNLSFAYTQYIKFHSNRDVYQAYNIVILQILLILYISDTNSATIKEIRILISTLSNNGFQQQRLLAITKRFLLKEGSIR
jgi:hypothetical protein